MGVLSKFFSTSSSTPQGGICNGDTPGHIGVWVNWDTKLHPSEVFRVSLRAESITGLKVDPVTFTFEPAFDTPFYQSVETTYELKEFLVGRYQASQGSIIVDFLCSGTLVLRESYDLDFFKKVLRGKGPEAPAFCKKAIPKNL